MQYNASMENWLDISTFLLFVLQKAYWLISEKRADREKPRVRKRPPLFNKARIIEYGVWCVLLLLFVQLILHVSILPMGSYSLMPQIGFLLVVLGLGLGLMARRQLAENWAHSWEYQVKQKQELVTTGIYSLIRHPIYASFAFASIGAELVAKSWLVVLFFGLFWTSYRQAKKEEILLEGHFGAAYKMYMNHTKMFIPFLW